MWLSVRCTRTSAMSSLGKNHIRGQDIYHKSSPVILDFGHTTQKQ